MEKNGQAIRMEEWEKHYGDDAYRPAMSGVVLSGKRGRLLGRFFKTGGAGLHPTVLLLHGIPGAEQNLDLAQHLRREGFHVLTFHYSGSWGSDGDYALAHNLEDSHTALDFLLHDETFGVDASRIFVVGHSLGCFVGGHLMARRPEIRAGVFLMPCDIGRMALPEAENDAAFQGMRQVLRDTHKWLRGTCGEALSQEIAAHVDAYQLSSVADALAKKPILCITGTLDTTTPEEAYCTPLRQAICAAGGTLLRYSSYPTDHCFSDYRLTVAAEMSAFLKAQL